MPRNVFMRKAAIVISLLLLVMQFGFTAPTAAATSYTWNNIIPVKYPTAATNNGKLVLFDNSHDETAGAADWVLDGGFSDFADDLVAHGYTVKEYRGVDKNGDGIIRYYDDRTAANVATNEEVITYDGIKDADVFVIAEANRPLTTSEQAALKQFVDSGKGIYFIADHYNSDRNMNTWDSTEVYDGYNRSTNSAYNYGGAYGDERNPDNAASGWLAQNFGLRFRFNAIDYLSGLTGIRSTTDSEGITQGVQPVLMAAGSTLAIVDGSKAKGIVYFGANDTPTKWASAADQGLYYGGESEGPFVAISKPSLGKAAFIGDSSPIEDASAKYKNEQSGSTKSNHAGYTSAGNAAVLSINIVNWLSNTESYVGFDGVNHTKGINTPNPMAPVELSQPGTEPWATPTYDPWNTDTYATGSYNAPSGTAPTLVSVTGITLNKTSASLNAGDSLILTPTFAPTNASDKNITWTSSNTAVATVRNGVITAVAAGSAVITVTTADGGKTATCSVTVGGGTTVPVTGVTVSPTSASMNTGDILTLTAAVSPLNATNQNVTWSSSNSLVASVSNGVVTANAAGSTVITVTTADGGYTATCSVTVAQSQTSTSVNEGFDGYTGGSTGVPAGWTFTGSMGTYTSSGNYGASAPSVQMNATGNQIMTPTFTLGGQGTLSFWIKGEGTNSSSHLLVESYNGSNWSTLADISSLPSTGTVETYTLSQNTTQVRFTYTKSAGNLAFDDVSVSSTSSQVNVTGVSLNTTSMNMNVGDNQTLTATVSPSNATNQSVTWTSSNTSVATVSNGLVTAAAAGSAVITVTTADGGYTATCNVTVSSTTVPVTGVTVSPTSASLNVGGTQTLTATVAPSNATNKSVTWTSSNTSVATVSNGLVTAVAAGTAVITVTTADGGYTATCSVTVTQSQPSTLINEGFDSYTGGTTGVPAGWTFTGSMSVYTTTGNYGASSPSVKMQATGNCITTPSFSLSAQGTLSFWIKGQTTDTNSHLLVEVYNGSSWSTLADIKPLPTTATTETFTLTQTVKQVRFTYTKSAGNLALDDVKISQ